ncbi:MAG: GerMN domain-containing protein [Anaerolineales bacterium]
MQTKKTSTNNKLFWVGCLISCLLVLSGCMSATPSQPTSPPPTPTATEEATQGEAEALAELAKEDLAGRTNLETEDISTQSVEEKVFPDASLGVPQPGMSYAQVTTPGYIIILEAGGDTYEYHAAESRVVLVPEETATPETADGESEMITIPSEGLQFEIPASWKKVEGAQAWNPEGNDKVYLGFHTEEIEPPAEVEAVMMPSALAPSPQAITQGREEISTNLGDAFRYTIHIVDPNAEGEEPVGVETHVIYIKTEEDSKIAYDFYLGAPDEKGINKYLPILLHTLDTSQFTSEENGRTVTIFFNNSELNPEGECDQVFTVTRQITSEDNQLAAALNELFRGPTPSEAEEGYLSFFSEETKDILIDVKIEGNTAYVNLKDIRSMIPGVSSSCGSQEFFAKVKETIQAQAPGVEKVLYAIKGDPEPFYEWVQLGCQEFNDFCDPAPFEENGKTVTIFFNNSELNPEAECDQVFPVTRQITPEDNQLAAALNELFRGPTSSEAEEGYVSFFSEETGDILIDIKIERNTAYVNLEDIRSMIPGVSSSCGSQEFFAEVKETIQAQTPGVEKVLYAIEGDPEPFYEWVQLGCQDFNDFCDPAPFQDMQP